MTGGREADLYAATEQGLVLEPGTTHVRGSGSSAAVPALAAPVVRHEGTTTTIKAGVEIVLPRVLVAFSPEAGLVLSGTWPGQETPRVLARVDVSA